MPSAAARRPTQGEQVLLFAKNFVKHPKMLGSVIPSSRFLIARVLEHVNWERARVIVEYGPGVGTFTREILQHMHRDSVLVVLETNPEFVRFLRKSISDPRLHVVEGSAADIRKVLADLGLEAADYVISGIPFSTLPEELREEIVHATREALRPSGAFLVYQFSAKVLPYLKKAFKRVRRGFEPWNVLPAHIFSCTP